MYFVCYVRWGRGSARQHICSKYLKNRWRNHGKFKTETPKAHKHAHAYAGCLLFVLLSNVNHILYNIFYHDINLLRFIFFVFNSFECCHLIFTFIQYISILKNRKNYNRVCETLTSDSFVLCLQSDFHL